MRHVVLELRDSVTGEVILAGQASVDPDHRPLALELWDAETGANIALVQTFDNVTPVE